MIVGLPVLVKKDTAPKEAFRFYQRTGRGAPSGATLSYEVIGQDARAGSFL
jgi:hypothetical protein